MPRSLPHIENTSPILVMHKMRSPDIIQFVPIDEDFLYVVTRAKKTNTIKNASMIVLKDMNDWVSNFQSIGWNQIA